MKHFLTLIVFILMVFGCKSENEKRGEFSVKTSPLEGQDRQNDTSEIEINPISHATAVITWGESTIYLDPTGGAKAFERMENPDLVLITDIHGDHLDSKTLTALEVGKASIIVPKAVKEKLQDTLASNLRVLNNGETLQVNGFSIEAIPMYNLREEAKQYHQKGRGNGYVLEKDGQRLYIAGDTEVIPEMRNLKDIDVALIPMNLPYTMTVEKAAEAVLEFAPRKVVPYHFRGTQGMSDVDKFKQLVKEGNPEIEVEMLEWYPEKTK